MNELNYSIQELGSYLYRVIRKAHVCKMNQEDIGLVSGKLQQKVTTLLNPRHPNGFLKELVPGGKLKFN